MTESYGVPGLLAELAASGISLRLEGEALRFTAPAGVMTAELRTRLQAAKPALIAHLRHAATRQPASLTQRRFWQLQQLDPDWPFYNVAFLFRLTGPLDPARLQRAADAVVARHDSLRTTLHDEDGRLMQHVAPLGAADFKQRDMVGADEAAIRAALQTELLRRYDLACDRILRLMLVRIAAETWMLQICLHNVVFDMASLIVILDEMSQLYADPGASLPAPVQYNAFVAWQTARAATGMDRRRDHWRRFMANGEPKPWSWPAIAAPGGTGFRALPTWTRLNPDRHLRLQAFCRIHGVTPAIAVLTAYFQAVSGFTGCDDLTIGTTWSDRDDQRFATMIGASIGVPAIRVDLRDDPPIAALLRRVREAVADAVAHQDLPIEEVVPRDSAGPLFRMVFTNFPSTPHGRLILPGLRVSWEEEWLNPISRPQLYLVMWETPQPGGVGLTCHMMHREDVWDAELAVRMMQRFEAAIAGMVA